jgi:hypothetical protein
VEDPGIGDAENACDVLARKIVRIGMEVSCQRHRADRNELAPHMKDAGKERVRHGHQRKHVDLARRAITDPEF